MDMIFRQLNPHACRTYMIRARDDKNAVIIDPVLDHLNDYMELIRKDELILTHVIDTHTHADHISGAPALKDMTGCAYVMHENASSQCVSFRVIDGTKLGLCGIKINVLYTPGHTKDSISLILPDRIITGDVLFLDDGGAGRDDLPGGDPGEHWESLEKIKRLPENLVVYPAHEYRNRQPSDLANQKVTNPHLKPRTKDEFIAYIEDLKLGPAEWMKDVLKANYACARDPKAAWIPVDLPACEVKGTLDYGVNDLEVQPIAVERLKELLDSDDSPFILDVREEKELVSPLGHLPNIKHIPITDLIDRLDELDELKDQEIVTVCRSGARAFTAAQIMKHSGYKNVSVLDGGMLRWNHLGLPTKQNWPEEE